MSDLKLNTPIPIEEIDFRVQSINKGGYATILAYKDARVDMNRLDAVYGIEGWQKKYDLIDNHLFCSVGVWSEKLNQWIWKQDVGTESNTEKEKGEASDAFKRACFNLGIGRELYAYPLIQIKLNPDEFDTATSKPTWNFKLKEWIWNAEFVDGKLTKLSCVDNKKATRFSYPSNQKQETTPPSKPPEIPQMTEAQKTKIISFSSMTSYFNDEKIKGMLEWITKPQTQENAYRFINRLESTVSELNNAENPTNPLNTDNDK